MHAQRGVGDRLQGWARKIHPVTVGVRLNAFPRIPRLRLDAYTKFPRMFHLGGILQKALKPMCAAQILIYVLSSDKLLKWELGRGLEMGRAQL